MIYLFIIICTCIWALVSDASAYGVSIDHMTYAYCYQFFHASWQHLLVNSLSLALMFTPIKRVYEERFGETSQWEFWFILYLGSVLAALFCARSVPTVGASGMVFFLLGMLIMLRPTLRQLQSYIYVAIAIIIQFFRGNSNVALHIVAFVLGALFIIIRIFCKDQRDNIERLD